MTAAATYAAAACSTSGDSISATMARSTTRFFASDRSASKSVAALCSLEANAARRFR
jgi:hypothetical protein